ncbi:hypothetical protein Dimus_006814 [Dionaea muscipula]
MGFGCLILGFICWILTDFMTDFNFGIQFSGFLLVLFFPSFSYGLTALVEFPVCFLLIQCACVLGLCVFDSVRILLILGLVAPFVALRFACCCCEGYRFICDDFFV